MSTTAFSEQGGTVNINGQQRRAVITGIGVVAPNGQDVDTFWASIRDGVSAADFVTRFDVSNVPSKIAAEVKDFDPLRFIDHRKAKRLELAIQYGIAAAKMAIENAQLTTGTYNPERVGVIEATSISGMESTLKAHLMFLAKGWKGMSPFTFLNAYCGGGSGEIALEVGAKGHAITYCSGSCSGNDAVGHALSLIEEDDADVVVVGGAEAPLIEAFWSGFCVAKTMTRRTESPQTAMRPFDRKRDGFVLGEGSVFLVIEEVAHALSRGAPIYAELLSHGRSCEAFHSVSPHPEGLGMCRAIEKALRKAGVSADEVDYVNVHGTATEANDPAEARAIRTVFKNRLDHVAVSSTKPVTGHLLGAAGALETAVCALTLRHQQIPPTLNLNDPEEGCDGIHFVRPPAPSYPVNIALNINSGFGGKNSCLVLRRPKVE